MDLTLLWKLNASELNVHLLEEAGLTIGDFQLYLENCRQTVEAYIDELSPADTANMITGMMVYCHLFTKDLPYDLPSEIANRAIADWLVVHGPPLCVASNLMDEGSADPTAELQIMTALAQAAVDQAVVDRASDRRSPMAGTELD